MGHKVGDVIPLKPRIAERIGNWIAEGNRVQGLINEAITVAALDADVDFDKVAVGLSKDAKSLEILEKQGAADEAPKDDGQPKAPEGEKVAVDVLGQSAAADPPAAEGFGGGVDEAPKRRQRGKRG